MAEGICYMHVGTGKTGTTAIQYALVKARDELVRRGVDYPDFSGNLDAACSGVPTAGNGKRLFALLRNGETDAALHILENFPLEAGNFVISSEGLLTLPNPTWVAFLDGVKKLGYLPKCCACFRPQSDFLVSHYLQAVKAGKIDWRESLDEFANKTIQQIQFENKWNWLRIANKLEIIFGKGNCTILWYPYFARQGRDALIRAIFDWIGQSGMAVFPQAEASNPSPNTEAMQLLRMLNSVGLGGRPLADEFLAEAQRNNLLGGRVSLSNKLSGEINRLTRGGNREMLEKFAPSQYTELDFIQDVVRPDSDGPGLNKHVFGGLLQLAGTVLAKQ